MKKTKTQQENEEIDVIISEIKTRMKWTDKEVGKLIGITNETLRNKRCRKVLNQIDFNKVAILADAAGYDIKFVKREAYM